MHFSPWQTVSGSASGFASGKLAMHFAPHAAFAPHLVAQSMNKKHAGSTMQRAYSHEHLSYMQRPHGIVPLQVPGTSHSTLTHAVSCPAAGMPSGCFA